MKKKILSLCLVVALAATAVIGGTLAYFTDTDAAKNVMTTGNVKIVQNEQERNADGDLVDFVDNHKLIPYTGKVDANGMATEYGATADINGTDYDMFDQNKNAIDKIITVTNEGTEECYVRTLIAMELIPVKDKDGNITGYQRPTANGTCGDGKYIYTTAEKDAKGYALGWCTDENGDMYTITVDGVEYCVFWYDYNGILAAGETTAPSLRNFYLNANAGNEWFDLVGKEYTILGLSQAVQTQGFKTSDDYDWDEANAAFNAAFGPVDEVDAAQIAVIEGWFADCE